MSRCPDSARIAAYLDDRLFEEERRALEEHFAGCESCWRVFADSVASLAEMRAEEATTTPAPRTTLLKRAASSPRSRGWAAAAAMMAATAGGAAWWLHFQRAHPNDGRVESVAGIVERRPVVPRFHGAEWKPRPNDRLRGSNAASLEPGAWRYQKMLDDARVAAGESPAGAQLQRLGAAYVLAGNADEGLQTLQRATAAVPNDAQALSDLGAAYLSRGIARDDGNDMAQALETIDRALEAAPDLLEAKFNRAVALQELPLPAQAARAWQAYLDVDSRSDWAREAQAQLVVLAKRTVEAPNATQLRVDIVAATAAGDASLIGLVRAHRQEAREAFMLDLLPAWSSAVLESNEAEAAARLDAAGRLAGEWNRQTDDRSLVRQMADIEAAGSDRENFARGHLALARGMESLESLQVERAATAFGDAQRELPASSAARAWADLSSLACDFYRRGPTAELLEQFDALEARAREDAPLQAHLDWLRGLLRYRRGEPQALVWYDQALTTFERLGEGDHTLWLHSLLGDAHTLFGDLPRAWFHRREVLAGLPALTHHERRFYLLLAPAIDAAYLERRPQVGSAFLEELSSEATPWRPAAATELELWRSRVQLMLGDREQARSALRDASAWLLQVDDLAVRRRLAADLQAASGMATDSGQLAVAALSAAVDRMRAGAPDYRFPGLLLERARAYRGQGERARAAADLREGIAWLLRQSPRDAMQGLLADRLSGGDALFDELVELELEAGAPTQAFAAAELARSRMVVRGAGDAQPTTWVPSENGGSQLNAVKERLEPGTTLLYFCLLAKEALLWRVDSAGASMVRLDARPEDVTAWATQLETDLAGGVWTSQTREAARGLYRALLTPAHLPSGMGRVVIVPDRRLDQLPFAALVDPNSGRFLVEQHALELAPSAMAYLDARARAHQLRTAQPSVLVLGNPRPDADLYADLPALPAAAAEARQVAQLYSRRELLLDERATRDALVARAGRYDVLHFAGHAMVNPVDPARSSLALARTPGSTRPGALFAFELTPEQFEHTRTVVLAGCSTGSGPDIGAGAMSLARAFLAARVPTVVASFWPVRDGRAVEVMTTLHAGLSQGEDPADALRAAQLAALRSPQPSLRSPATWAAFGALGG